MLFAQPLKGAGHMDHGPDIRFNGGSAMAVSFDEKEQLFILNTKNTTYQFKTDCHGFLLHLYYGKRIQGSAEFLLQYIDRGFSGNPSCAVNDRNYSMDVLPLEMPVWGSGDFRSPSLIIEKKDGTRGAEFKYSSHRIYSGKYSLLNLPAVYAREDEAQTLEVILTDELLGLKMKLLYGVLPDIDVITRAVMITNESDETVYIDKLHSASLDIIYGEHDLITFCGRHMKERGVLRQEINTTSFRVLSRRGTSSHQYNPLVIIADKDTSDTSGTCIAMEYVYSGGFLAEAEKDQFGTTRLQMGLCEEELHYPLGSKKTFTAPEVIMACSTSGLDSLSHSLHSCINDHIIRGRYKNAPRPVLVNSWEANYFDIDRKKLLDLAAQSVELGIEMLVIDDGWFGRRNDDNSSLGDWYADERKLGGSLEDIVRDITAMGLKCGIWMEPEMVSEDSDLFRAHPDWALATPGRSPVRGRNQLVLDMSRKEVRDHIYAQICSVLDCEGISYLKWDFNRSICDAYSPSADHQGSVLYDYVTGLYEVLEKLCQKYPDVLIEGCSGGGGRYDAGMLYYTPQIWCSDNTDPVDRLSIQYGTCFGYPASVLSAHVSRSPNEQNGRVTPLMTRGIAAMYGAFGFELDPALMSEEEKDTARELIHSYKKYEKLIREGKYYRLSDPEKDAVCGWCFAAHDGSEVLVHAVRVRICGNAPVSYLKIKGLKSGRMYLESFSCKVYPADVLSSAGIPLPQENGEYRALRYCFELMDEEQTF